MKVVVLIKKPFEEVVAMHPVQVGRRTKKTLGEPILFWVRHMLPWHLRWRAIWFYMVSWNPWKTLVKSLFQYILRKQIVSRTVHVKRVQEYCNPGIL